MQSRATVVAAAVFAVLWCAPRVRAGGIEYAGQGARALARGGAVAARAEDPLVLARNPAGLAELRGSQLMLDLTLAIFDACVDPAGYYGWGTYLGGQASELTDPQTGAKRPLELGVIDATGAEPIAVAHAYYTDPYDTVCLDQAWTPIPQLVFSTRVSEELGLGFGFIFPSAQPAGSWGDDNGVIRNEHGELRPAATRYMGIRASNLGVFPTLGAGYRAAHALRIGAALEWGVIAANNVTMAGAVGGTSPATDVLVHITAQDWFVPAFTASVHLVPIDAIDLVLAFRYQDDFDAPGNMNVTTGLHDPLFKTATTKNIRLGSVAQSFPWKLRAGARYADRLSPRAAGTGRGESDPAHYEPIHDPLEDERWDVELDLEYEINSRNDAQVVSYEGVSLVDFIPENPLSAPMRVELPHPMGDQQTVVEKHWQDQLSIRLGSTYNPLPGVLGISAGAHYETRGVTPAFMQTDFWPVARLGLHSGVTLRIGGAIDVVLAYAHIFQETIVVAPPPHRAREEIDRERLETGRLWGIDKTVGAPLDRSGAGTTVIDAASQGTPDGVAGLDQNLNRVASGQPPFIVNAGRYRSSYDIVSVGVNVHF